MALTLLGYYLETLMGASRRFPAFHGKALEENQLVTFVPIRNVAYSSDIDNFVFQNGIHLTKCNIDNDDIPSELAAAMQATARSYHVSPQEVFNWMVTGAWLWKTEVMDLSDRESARLRQRQASSDMQALLWCVDLAGCGENELWRSAGVHNNGVYHCWGPHVPISPPHRFPFMYSVPFREREMAPWSKERLQRADQLYQALVKCGGKEISRMGLAVQFRSTMTSLDVWHSYERTQLATTALETFYVGPNERKYIWQVQDRLRGICEGELLIPDDYFVNLQSLRNNLVHRGGILRNSDRPGWNPEKYKDTIILTEDILRVTLAWAYLNSARVAEAFETEVWTLPSLSNV